MRFRIETNGIKYRVKRKETFGWHIICKDVGWDFWDREWDTYEEARIGFIMLTVGFR